MNKQAKSDTKRGIEWTDYTWNPIGGCKHKCRWEMTDGSIAICYAEAVAHRLASSAYPNGFDYHYWRPEVLNAPLGIQQPARIFLDSMSDLMGHWVPKTQIEQVLSICEQSPQHVFQLLTKNAPRLLEFDFPPNVWIGVSAPPTFFMGKRLSISQQIRMVTRQMTVLEQLKVSVRWMSIEPLSFDIAPLLTVAPLEWVVIGAATNGRKSYQPDSAWVRNLLEVLDEQLIPVFFKGNLDWHPRREKFPEFTITEVAGHA